jgi:hypothetical protein
MINELLHQKLSDWRPVGEGRHTWSHVLSDHNWNVLITANQVDSLSAKIWELNAARINLIDSNTQQLTAWADKIAKRVTGLMEPLQVIEIDSTRQEAILRSQSPTNRGDQAFYYEVKLLGTSRADVRRYQSTPKSSNRRQQVAFALTHEVTAKLFSDLISE